MDKDTEFLTMAEAEMASLENWLEEAGDDFDCSRSGNVLTIELDSGEQVVVNIQTPMHESEAPRASEATTSHGVMAHGATAARTARSRT